MRSIGCAATLVFALALAGCAAAPPTGPYIAALPGKDKTFEAFQADDVACRQYASSQIGYASPATAATQSAVGSTALGTVVGAAAGAAIGAAAGNPAMGAAIGAGTGFVTGGAAGIGAANASASEMQWRYDVGYAQCMTANGENVQMPGPAYTYAPPPYYPYYPPYFGPAFLGVGFGFGFHGHGHHHFGHFRH
jgi:outer membrane lipoprotein SlyB